MNYNSRALWRRGRSHIRPLKIKQFEKQSEWVVSCTSLQLLIFTTAVSERAMTCRRYHESDLMLWENSWTHWVITAPILIPSFSNFVGKLHLFAMEGNAETQRLWKANGFILKTQRPLTNGCHHGGRGNERRQKQLNKLRGRVRFHLHVSESDRWLINTGGGRERGRDGVWFQDREGKDAEREQF